MFGDVVAVDVDEPEIAQLVWLEPVSSFSTLGKELVELAV